MRQIVTASQIGRWFQATNRAAQGLLPLFVRNLILATVPCQHLRAVHIPAGDQVSLPGYDGRVEVDVQRPYVPNGVSVWEMGTGAPREKAQQDYRSRSDNPRGLDPKLTTFVFVSPHPWRDKSAWQEDKKAEAIWQDVRVFDGVDLETWAGMAPSAARWLASEMGCPANGIRGVDEVIKEEFDVRFGRDIPPSLVIAGRDMPANSLRDWIDGDLRELRIQGESEQEASLFIAAVVALLPDDVKQRVMSRMLFLDAPAAVGFLSGLYNAHIVVPTCSEAKLKIKAMDSPSIRLIVPEAKPTAGAGAGSSTVQLGSVQRASCEQALKDMGIGPLQVHRIAKESKGSLTAILRMLDQEGDVVLPWTEGATARNLLPLLMAGQWSADSAADQEVIERLAGLHYTEIELTLAEWTAPSGPLVRRGAVWDWRGWDHAWHCLSHFIDKGVINRFREVALNVLGAADPKLDLSPEDRWAADIYGKRCPWSSHLRQGLVGSVVQIALHGAELQDVNGQSEADVIVRELLNGENCPLKETWLSLAHWLPDLAEAAPDAFLSCLDGFLQDKEAVKAMFEESGLWGGSEHTHLLWALERLGWSEDYVTRVTLALGALAALDPGGRTANRPIASLCEILSTWHPRTMANLQHKLDALDALHRRNPDVAWRLALCLLPDSNSIASGVAEPRWRDWKPVDRVKVLVREYRQYVEALVTKLIEWSESSGKRWAGILDKWYALRNRPRELADRIISALDSTDAASIPDADREMVCASLRKTMAYYRRFKEGEDGLTGEEFEKLGQLLQRFQPMDLLFRHQWLFAAGAGLPDGPPIYEEAGRQAVLSERMRVVREIVKSRGVEGILRVSETAQLPSSVGIALADAEILSPDEQADMLCRSLSAEPTRHSMPPALGMAIACISSCAFKQGEEWINRVVSDRRVGWDASKYANFALGLALNSDTWRRVRAWGPEVEEVYWKRVRVWPWSLATPQDDAEVAARSFLKAKRPCAALILVAGLVKRDGQKGEQPHVAFPVELLVRILSEAPKQDPNEELAKKDLRMLCHDVSELLDYLEQAGLDMEQIAGFEWAWMPALDQTEHGLKALKHLLSTSPNLFVDILKLAFRGEDEEQSEVTEEDRAMAQQAFRILDSWDNPPGSSGIKYPKKTADGDIEFPWGEIDAEEASKWIAQARSLSQECGRLGVCDTHIGGVLAYAPKDANGTWPCREIRDILEGLASEDIECGLSIGVRNRRGFHGREKEGAQELRLADKFEKFAVAARTKWPRTAAVLGLIADSFRQEAKSNAQEDAFRAFEW